MEISSLPSETNGEVIDILNFYLERVELYKGKLTKLDEEIRQISLKRLASIVMVGLSLYGGFSTSGYLFSITAIFFGVFLYYVKKHTLAFQARVLLAELLLLNQREVSFKKGDKSVFDSGIDFDPEHSAHHLFALDLDIFGTGSLFQSINRSSTRSGRQLLAKRLLIPLTDPDEIEMRKQSIHELSSHIDWRQEFYAIGMQIGEKPKDADELSKWLSLPDFFEGRIYWKGIMLGMTFVSGLIIAYCILTAQLLIALLFMPLVINGVLLSIISRTAKEYFAHFGNRTKQFKKYADLFAHINKRKFISPESAQLHQECKHASQAFEKLFQVANLTEQRANGVVGPLMNGFFLFDLWCIYRIENWRRKNKDQFPAWINSLISIDMISSFSNFTFNHPDFSDAIIQRTGRFISAKQMGHPLMNSRDSIKNDYEVGVTSKIHIITGSNMAGKSTFIRALGVNLILARNGVPVCAEEFICSTLGLITSIRISDSLEENASYFKAELIRLEQLLNQLKTGQPFLVLLDEILRGTNSDDKRLGTQSFILKLKQFNCLVLLATHDLSIGKLEQEFPEYIENYCFESQFTNEGLSFDYKLRKGVSSSTNATFLMKRMGLID